MSRGIAGDRRLLHRFRRWADGGMQRGVLRVVTSVVDLMCCSLQGMESRGFEGLGGIMRLLDRRRVGVVLVMIDAFATNYPAAAPDRASHYTVIDWLRTQSEIVSSLAVSLSSVLLHGLSFHWQSGHLIAIESFGDGVSMPLSVWVAVQAREMGFPVVEQGCMVG
jgi:hypothetical protein